MGRGQLPHPQVAVHLDDEVTTIKQFPCPAEAIELNSVYLPSVQRPARAERAASLPCVLLPAGSGDIARVKMVLLFHDLAFSIDRKPVSDA